VELTRLWLRDFRNHHELDLALAPGVTAVLGPNGVGKTNLLEAVALLSTARSFRGVPAEALVRLGAERAVVRAEGVRGGRPVLIELELSVHGRSRVQVNRQRLSRTRDLLGALRTTVFSPEDLALVKAGPVGRRGMVDELLVSLEPAADRLLGDLDRVLRQRGSLLKQSGGRLDETGSCTLEVWDHKLVELGEEVGRRRDGLVAVLGPLVDEGYRAMAGGPAGTVEVTRLPGWPGGDLASALAGARRDDLRRGVTTVGPHRDDIRLTIGGLAARTQASQGEQRTLALALRLAGHRLVAERLGEAPLLLLDDVLSELDPGRCEALLGRLPPGQVVITSAQELPPAARADRLLRFERGRLGEVA
jgi:DNA replication and repair protein RecF